MGRSGGKVCLTGALVDELTSGVREYLRQRTLDDLLKHCGLQPEIGSDLSLPASDGDGEIVTGTTK